MGAGWWWGVIEVSCDLSHAQLSPFTLRPVAIVAFHTDVQLLACCLADAC